MAIKSKRSTKARKPANKTHKRPISKTPPTIKSPSDFEDSPALSTEYQHLQARLERIAEQFNAAQAQWQQKITQVAHHSAVTNGMATDTAAKLEALISGCAKLEDQVRFNWHYTEQQIQAVMDRVAVIEDLLEQLQARLQGLQRPWAQDVAPVIAVNAPGDGAGDGLALHIAERWSRETKAFELPELSQWQNALHGILDIDLTEFGEQ